MVQVYAVRGRKTSLFGNDKQVLEEGHGGFQKVMRALLECGRQS